LEPRGNHADARRLKQKGIQMYRHILIATDGSKPSERALSAGLSLAKHLGAEVSVIVVEAPFSKAFDMPAGDEGEQIKQHAASVLRSAAKAGEQSGVTCQYIQAGPTEVHDAIIANARERGCDLIVMGSRGTSGLALELLGSVAQKVLTISTLPVLVYR
jgi:nucleotide-binding universal stress UspA family protein